MTGLREPYIAFKETDACARCGEGESWTVKGPDDVCIGQSWEGDEAECNAEETAQMLNAAFEAGQRSGYDEAFRSNPPARQEDIR